MSHSNGDDVIMSSFWKMASVMVLPLSLALVGTGCMAQAGDDESATEADVTADQGAEQTGEAAQAQGLLGFSGFGDCGNPWFNQILGFNFIEGIPFLRNPCCF